MKDEVLKRSMFSQPMTKAARNSGIMAGFDDEEMNEPEGPEEPEEQMSPMARTPQNPEILMNTLRGDMRSVDARYQELAQMVGEEAAQETPPEVLALLQAQLGAQQPQGGIGALPQSPGMQGMPGAAPQGMPPGMPPQGAGPQAPVGAPPFPQGASAPQQFSHGGAVEPPTPDGLPPLHANIGLLVEAPQRFAQAGAYLAQRGADKIGPLATEANAVGGQLLSRGFPQQFPAIFENLRGPGGRYIAEQTLKYPTLTEHLGNVVESSPWLARAAGAVAASPVVMGMRQLTGTMPEEDKRSPERRGLEASYEEAYRKAQPDTSVPMPSTRNMSDEELKKNLAAGAAATAPAITDITSPAPAPAPAEEQKTEAAPATTGEFIAAQAAKKPAEAGPEDTIAKTKELYKGYQPLFKELMGNSGEDLRTQAALLLADAGFKYAFNRPTRGSTPAMLFAESFGDIPKGLAALAAQATANNVKINTAALQQALTDVGAQRKTEAEINKVITQKMWDYTIKNAENKGMQLEDLGGGVYKQKTKDGSYISGPKLNPEHPTYQSIMGTPEHPNRWTLSAASPYVQYRGDAPTAVVDNQKDVGGLLTDIRNIDDNLKLIENTRGVVAKAYSPGSWFSDTLNNTLVPVVPGMKPNLVTADAMTQLKGAFNTLSKNAAAMNTEGRVSVQQEGWQRGATEAIDKPDSFLKDPELAAKTLASLETSWRNARQQKLTQLGYEKRDLVMTTPAIGTQSDPFVLPSDEAQKRQMLTYLQNTIGTMRDPNARVYIKTPRGEVTAVSPLTIMQYGATK